MIKKELKLNQNLNANRHQKHRIKILSKDEPLDLSFLNYNFTKKSMKYLIYIISFSTLVSCVETKYYKNGNLKWQLTDTIDKYWYKNGQLKDEINYNEKVKFDGLQRSWYKNGQLWMEESYKNGKKDGLTKVYYENGQLRVEENYKDGKRLSKKRWDEEGKPIN